MTIGGPLDHYLLDGCLLKSAVVSRSFRLHSARAVLKLMFGALIRAAERWKSIKVTQFERRQLSAVKKELDQEYEVQVDLNRKPSKGAAQTKISSSFQT